MSKSAGGGGFKGGDKGGGGSVKVLHGGDRTRDAAALTPLATFC